MKYILESGTTMATRGDFTKGLPFYGSSGDFNFSLGRSKFSPGISIKQISFVDLSVKGDPGFSEFDNNMNKLKYYFKPGDRVRGTLVNSLLTTEYGKTVVGKLFKIKANHSTKTIQAWIKNPKNLKVEEIYIESLERIYESRLALTFSDFIGS